jgi:hypothetical protein
MNRLTCGRAATKAVVGAALAVAALTMATEARAQSLKLSPVQVLLTDEDERGPTLKFQTQLAVHSSGLLAIGAGDGWVGIQDPVTRKLRRIGRKGRGPNEYSDGVSVGWLGDTLWIDEYNAFRITTIPAQASGKALTTVYSWGRHENFQLAGFRGMVIGGALPVVHSPQRVTQLSGNSLRPPMLYSSRHPMRVRDTLFIEDHTNRLLVIAKGDAMLQAQQPFGDHTRWQVSDNGRCLARVEQSMHTTARKGPFGAIAAPRVELWEFTASKPALRRTVMLPEPAPLTAREVDAWITTQIASRRSAKSPIKIDIREADFRRALYVPPKRPAGVDVVVGSEGGILIRDENHLTKQATYMWIDADGRTRGTFTTPLLQRIRSLQGHRVWSLVHQDDETYVVTVQDIREDVRR